MTLSQKFFVKGYRWLAVALLGTVLSFAAGTLFLVVFYMINSSWGAPVVVTKANPRVVALSAATLQARQARDNLTIELKDNQGVRVDLVKQLGWYDTMLARYGEALKAQQGSDSAMAEKLASLKAEKEALGAKMEAIVAQNEKAGHEIDKELRAGLITRDSALQARAQLVKGEESLTANRVSLAGLENQIAQLTTGVSTMKGGADSPVALEVLARVNMLNQQRAEGRQALAKLDAQTAAKTGELSDVQKLLAQLSSSAFYIVSSDEKTTHQFAFVPYENEKAVAPGVPVYACKLKLVWCSKVGTVRTVTHDEEKARHPLFPNDVRGFLVELDLKDKAAAKETVIFFGSRPLWIL